MAAMPRSWYACHVFGHWVSTKLVQCLSSFWLLNMLIFFSRLRSRKWQSRTALTEICLRNRTSLVSLSVPSTSLITTGSNSSWHPENSKTSSLTSLTPAKTNQSPFNVSHNMSNASNNYGPK